VHIQIVAQEIFGFATRQVLDDMTQNSECLASLRLALLIKRLSDLSQHLRAMCESKRTDKSEETEVRASSAATPPLNNHVRAAGSESGETIQKHILNET